MNINGNYTNSWIHHGYGSQPQIFYTTMHQQQQGYYPNIEKTNFGNIIAKTTGFSNQPQQRNHHTMASPGPSSSSGYINIRELQQNHYPNNFNINQQNFKNYHQLPMQQQYHQPQQQQQQQNPHNMSNNNNGIINGLKNFVNGFINPKLNCNFYTDNHHRNNYNTNYRNNFMRNEQIDNIKNKQQQHSQNYESEPHAVFFNFTVQREIINSTQLTTTNIQKPMESTTSTDEVDHCHRPNEKSDNFAIFTLDDFPALPIPKQKININLWNETNNEKSKESCPFYSLKKGNLNNSKKNKMKQNKMKLNNKCTTNITTKPPTIDEDDDDDDCSDNSCFNNDNGGCNSNNNNGLRNNFSTNTENVQQERLNNNRKESECDSEDSFVIFTNQSPSNYETIINCSNNNKVNNSNAGTTPFRPRIRERQISECSEDSFIICFTDDAAEGVIEFSDGLTSSDEDDDSTDDDSSDYETDDDDDEDDEINDESKSKNNNVVNNNKKIISNNEKTENNNNDDTLSINGGHSSQPDSGFDERKEKKVRFNLNPEVHTMHTWSFAYRAARKGHWENYVRDRSRFGNRIERLSSILNPILDSKHRENIYKLRFCDNNDTIS